MKGFVTTSEAAARLGISTARVRQLILDGLLTADKFGRQNVISEKVLIEFEAKERKAGRPANPKGDR